MVQGEPIPEDDTEDDASAPEPEADAEGTDTGNEPESPEASPEPQSGESSSREQTAHRKNSRKHKVKVRLAHLQNGWTVLPIWKGISKS